MTHVKHAQMDIIAIKQLMTILCIHAQKAIIARKEPDSLCHVQKDSILTQRVEEP